MSRIVDNLIAYRVLSMLVANFEDTDAFKLGIIDKDGHALKKSKDLKTEEEKDAYDYLTRLVFNLKRLINKLPGGETKIKSMIAALWLVKEHYRTGSRSTAMLQEKFATLMKLMDNRVSLVEEEITVRKFLEEDGMGAGAIGGAPTNNTAGVAGLSKETGGPVIKKKDIKKYQGTVTRRSQLNIPEIKP
jgi:hypothetical protein